MTEFDMKLFQENEQVFGNSTETKTFTIAASAKAFKILSSNIYKNKIRAVVRELVCNAVDAHVLNSNTEPYTIKAPNRMDLSFSVRDYGPGLSDEDMNELYTTYFASTKAERNDQIGALGLGSKSPFSYTPTFSVVSYFDGMVRNYQCMLKNGEPAIVKTFEGQMEDGDKTGIKVTVPVKEVDIGRFSEELSFIMRPFKSGSYEIIGAPITVDSFDKLPQYNDNYFSIKTGTLKLYAIYGAIVYPLVDVPNLKSPWIGASNESIYFHFNAGELDFQPSREELSLDERTVANILKKVHSIDERKRDDDISELSKITNTRELKRVLTTLPSLHKDVIRTQKIEFQGKRLEFWEQQDSWLTRSFYDSFRQLEVFGNNSVGGVQKKTVCFTEPGTYRRTLLTECRFENLFDYRQKRVIILDIDSKTPHRKIINMMQWYGRSVSDDKYPCKNECVVVMDSRIEHHEKAFELIKTAMNGDEIIVHKLSDVENYLTPLFEKSNPKPIVVAKDKDPRPKSPNAIKYTYDSNYGGYMTKQLYMTSKEISELDGWVVGMYRDTITCLGGKWVHFQGRYMTQINSMASKLEIDEFVLVRPAIYERVEKNPNVKCLIQRFMDEYKKYIQLVQPDQYLYTNDGSYFGIKLRNNPKMKPLHKFFINVGRTNNSDTLNYWHDMFEAWTPFCDYFNGVRMWNKHYAECMEKVETSYNQKCDEFKKRFPAFMKALNVYYTIRDDELQKYVDQILFLEANGF